MDDHDAPALSLDIGASPAPKAPGYTVLARKYRPRSFADLIGQEALVRTLSNAFDSGRIAQAYVFTGVRGVGKTTTARILARALNYEIPGEIDKPTLHMDRLGSHCQAIMEGRHVDVMEIDAASHTGIDDVRQITDGARYAPVSARYKVYIVDEVHMLSEKAWNAFLKTLEEPPPHVKFMFATTEIRKVPVTVLSRCQRFDLRRVETEVIIAQLKKLIGLEGLEAEEEALALIARASEGSVRDSLSMLDQAIAHGAGRVEAEEVRRMLGLADRSRIVTLFEKLMGGDMAGSLADLRALHHDGADPSGILSELADLTHLVTRVKIVPDAANDVTLTPFERDKAKDFAARLPMRVLSRAWQMLMKGIEEVDASPRPLASADMVLVRIGFAADLPTPDEAMKLLAQMRDNDGAPSAAPSGGGGGGTRAVSNGAPLQAVASSPAMRPLPEARSAPQPVAGPRLSSLEEVAKLASERRDIRLKGDIEAFVRIVSFEHGKIECAMERGAPATLATEIAKKLTDWTGERWFVTLSHDEGETTLREKARVAREAHERGVRADPRVQAVLAAMPGAEIIKVVKLADLETVPDAPPPPDDEDGWEPVSPYDDDF